MRSVLQASKLHILSSCGFLLPFPEGCPALPTTVHWDFGSPFMYHVWGHQWDIPCSVPDLMFPSCPIVPLGGDGTKWDVPPCTMQCAQSHVSIPSRCTYVRLPVTCNCVACNYLHDVITELFECSFAFPYECLKVVILHSFMPCYICHVWCGL